MSAVEEVVGGGIIGGGAGGASGVVHSLLRIYWVLIVSLQDRYGRTW